MKISIQFFMVLGIGLVLISTVRGQQNKSPTLVVQDGHFGIVTALTYSRDEKLIASASLDGSIKLWALDTGLLLRTLKTDGSAHSVAIHPDGQLVAAANESKVSFWDIETGVLVRTLELKALGYYYNSFVTFSSDWKLLAACQRDAINLWDVSSGTLIHSFKTGGSCRIVAFSQDGKLLAYGDGNSVKVSDVVSGAPLHSLTGHIDEVTSLAFTPDGRVLASGSGNRLNQKENSLKLWAMPSGELLHSLDGKLLKPDPYGSNPVLSAFDFSPDSKFILTQGLDRGSSLALWDVASGKLVRFMKDQFPYSALALSPSWRTYAAIRPSDYALQLWDIKSGALIQDFAGQGKEVRLIEFSPDGAEIAVAVGESGWESEGYLWDFNFGPLPSRRLYFGGSKSYSLPHLSFKGGQLISAGVDIDNMVRVGNADNLTSFQVLGPATTESGTSALSTDGRRFAVADIQKHTITLWNLAQRKRMQLQGHEGLIDSLVFNPSGTQLASASWDRRIKVWDTQTGKLLHTLGEHTSIVTALAFSPDGQMLVSGSSNYLTARDHSIKLWDVQTEKSIATLEGHAEGVRLVAVSPDGKILASAGGGGDIKLWSLPKGELLHILPGTGVDITAIAFHPKSRFLIIGRINGTIEVLSSNTLSPVATVVALSADNWLITSPSGLFDGSDAALKRVLWRFSPALRDVAPVEAFFSEFYYPDLLSELLAGREPKVNQDITQKDRRQPQLKLVLADGAVSDPVSTRNIKVQIEVDNAEAGAKDLRLFRNGSLVKIWRGDVLQDQPKATLEATIPIVEGENRFTAYAFNRDNIKSTDASLVVTGAPSLKRYGVLYVLAIGIDDYANPDFALKYAVADAKAFAQDLNVDVSDKVIIPLYNKDASKENILLALKLFGDDAAITHLSDAAPQALRLIKRVQPEDVVVVYFAGHGTAHEKHFYLIPSDLGYDGSQQISADEKLRLVLTHSISDRELERAVEKLDVSRLLLVIDACNSGQALEAEEKRRGPMNSTGLAQLAYEKGMYILAAAQSYQAAPEVSELGHGLLTFVLVEEGLKGLKGDRDNDGILTAREWFDYATTRVPEKQIEKMKQRSLEIINSKTAKQRNAQLVFVEADNATLSPEKRAVQRPRIFYRREMEQIPLQVSTRSLGIGPP